jgi:hypothetical protein
MGRRMTGHCYIHCYSSPENSIVFHSIVFHYSIVFHFSTTRTLVQCLIDWYIRSVSSEMIYACPTAANDSAIFFGPTQPTLYFIFIFYKPTLYVIAPHGDEQRVWSYLSSRPQPTQ